VKKSLSILLLVAASSIYGQSPTISGDSGVVSRLRLYEVWVREQMAYQRQPSVVIGVVVDQELLWAKGFGYRDVERKLPATPRTVYRIASITKTFTAMAIMQLRDAGKLQLDDPVVQHLDWFEYRNRFPAAPVVTIRHLLTHTSGLPREANFPYWTDDKFPTREEMVKALKHQESVFPPETKYKYSNLALALAGEVVSVASGEPYADYIRNHILNPLGMTSSSVLTQDIDRERLATGYLMQQPDGSQPTAPETDSKGLTPAANMSSTVEDLARFVSLQFHSGPMGGGQIIQLSTLQQMHRVHWLNPDWSSGRGLGFSVWRQGERTLVGHEGWVAGHRTQIAFDPTAKIGVIVLTNCDEGGPGSYVRQMFNIVAPAIERAMAQEPQLQLADVTRYTGTYHDPSGWLTDFIAFEGHLVMYSHSYPPSRDPTSSITELTLEGEHTFRMTGRNGNGELVVFELRNDGMVARVKVGANYIFPEDCTRVDDNLQCVWQ
jgi:CubicO group peptidase (beta-lactamase class C family)